MYRYRHHDQLRASCRLSAHRHAHNCGKWRIARLHCPVALLGGCHRVNNRNGEEEEKEDKVASSCYEKEFERCVACGIRWQVEMGYRSSR